MTTMTENTNVLASGWVTTREASKEVGMSPNVFRVWLDRHEEVEKQYIGRLCVVRLDSVREARKSVQK